MICPDLLGLVVIVAFQIRKGVSRLEVKYEHLEAARRLWWF